MDMRRESTQAGKLHEELLGPASRTGPPLLGEPLAKTPAASLDSFTKELSRDS